MNFKVGDLAIVNKDNIYTKLRRGDVVTIMVIYPADIHYGMEDEYKVEDFMGERHRVIASDLDVYLELPIGTQIEYVLADVKECDCGGYKTYGSMDPSYHSQSLPCSSLKK